MFLHVAGFHWGSALEAEFQVVGEAVFPDLSVRSSNVTGLLATNQSTSF